MELYSDFEYNVTVTKNDATTTVNNKININDKFNGNEIRLGILHTQITQRVSTGEGTTTPNISRNIYINNGLQFTRSIEVTPASISISHEFCPLIAVNHFGNWHLIIYDDKKYTDEMPTGSEESLLKKFQYSTTSINDSFDYNYTINLNIDIGTNLDKFDYNLTYLQNSLGNIIPTFVADGIVEKTDNAYKIYCK